MNNKYREICIVVNKKATSFPPGKELEAAAFAASNKVTDNDIFIVINMPYPTYSLKYARELCDEPCFMHGEVVKSILNHFQHSELQNQRCEQN